MSTLRKMSSPSQEKEIASRLLKQKEEKTTICINVPASLKKRLKIAVLSNNTKITDLLLSYIQKYVKTEEQKDGE